MDKKGILYTSYYNMLPTKKVLNYTGEVFVISRTYPILELEKYTPHYKIIDGLKPTNENFNLYKSCRISWLKFEENYKKDVDMTSIKEITNILDKSDNVLLLCYEKSNKFCHRRLVSEMIKELGYETKEL